MLSSLLIFLSFVLGEPTKSTLKIEPNKIEIPAQEKATKNFQFELAKHHIDSAKSKKAFLNVLKAFNYTNSKSTIKVEFELPTGWVLSSGNNSIITAEVDTNNKKLIPFRILPSPIAITDSLYLIRIKCFNANTNEELFTDEFSVEVASIKSYEFIANIDTYVLKSDQKDPITIPVIIKNTGNVKQKFKLSARRSSVLNFDKKVEQIISLLPYSDTTINYVISLKNGVKPKNRNQLEFTLNGDDKKKKILKIYFTTINNYYDANLNRLDLNKIDFKYGVRNVASTNAVDFLRVNGAFNLKHERKLKLGFNSNNLSRENNSNTKWIQQQNINIQYKANHLNLFVDQSNYLGPFNMNALSTGAEIFTKKHKVKVLTGILTNSNGYQASYLHNYSVSDSLKIKFGVVSFNEIGLNVLTISPVFGTDFKTKSNHDFSTWVGFNNSFYENSLQQGIGGNLSYKFKYLKWNVSVTNQFASKEFRNQLSNGFNNVSSLTYRANKKHSFKLLSNQYSFNPLIQYSINAAELPGERSLFSMSSFYERKAKNTYKIGLQFEDGYMEKTSNSVPFGSIQYSVINSLETKFSKTIRTSLSLESGLSEITFLADSIEATKNNTHFLYATAKAQFRKLKISSRYNLGPDDFNQQSRYFMDGVFAERLNMNLSYANSLFKDKIKINLGLGNSLNVTDKVNTPQVNSGVEVTIYNTWDLCFNTRFNSFKLEDFFNNNDPTAFNPLAVDLSLKKRVKGILQAHNPSDLSINIFKDDNGNGVFDNKEYPIENITVQISPINTKDKYVNTSITLNTDTKGNAKFLNIPAGTYKLDIITSSTKDGYISTTTWSDTNLIEVKRKTNHKVGFKKGLLIQGKLSVKKSKYSQFKNISAAKTRILVTSSDGKTFYTLTDDEGNYRLSVPFDGDYKITVKNVFGKKFEIPTKKVILKTATSNKVIVNLLVKEKSRKINFK